MDKSLRIRLEEHEGKPSRQYEMAGITADGVKHYILSKMDMAIAEDDWEARSVLYGMACSIENEDVKADVLNNLLIMPGHELHQEITMRIQRLGHPASIPYIRKMLESGFDTLQYTCSEDEVIAKWFSHALANIDTPESIAMIREFASSPNQGIASEMRYRLKQEGYS